MKARIANKIVKRVGFHRFKWHREGDCMVGVSSRPCSYRLGTVTRAWKARTIYRPVDRNLKIVHDKELPGIPSHYLDAAIEKLSRKIADKISDKFEREICGRLVGVPEPPQYRGIFPLYEGPYK